MDGYSGEGQWRDIHMGTATASIRKFRDAKKWILSVGAIKMKATANIPVTGAAGERVAAYREKPVGKCVQARSTRMIPSTMV
jgi:hypothetical protein